MRFLDRCSPGGIGNALAREFHARGLRVFATARAVKTIGDLEELGVECLQLDITVQKSVEACARLVESLLDGKGLDYLINNAGICAWLLIFLSLSPSSKTKRRSINANTSILCHYQAI